MRNSAYKIIMLTAVLLVSTPSLALSAQLYFEPAKQAAVFDAFAVTVRLNTQGESINAVSGEVKINPQLGAPKAITDSASILTYWIERPQFDAGSGVVKFSGSLPGGYKGPDGVLFTLVFSAYNGEVLADAVTMQNERVLRSDGLGSRVKSASTGLNLDPRTLVFDNDLSKKIFLDFNRKDNVPPEVFTPQIARDPNIYNGKWFISFNTTDKQSGVDHYEIQETKTGRINSGRWKIIDSPYLLEDQELQSYIYVIAIDRQGNERVIKVFPKHPQSWLIRNKDFLIVCAILLLLAGWTQRQRRKRKHKLREEINL